MRCKRPHIPGKGYLSGWSVPSGEGVGGIVGGDLGGGYMFVVYIVLDYI